MRGFNSLLGLMIVLSVILVIIIIVVFIALLWAAKKDGEDDKQYRNLR
jgi:uncharacterized membrane protein